MAHVSSRLASVLAMLLLASCAQATQIVLVVDTDFEVPTELRRVEIDVFNSMAAPTRTSVDLTGGDAPALPLTLGITSRARADADVRVEVRGVLESGEILVRDVSTRLAPGGSRMLRVVLARRCLEVVCGPNQTCDETGCRNVEIAVEELPAWTGSVARQDGPACEVSDEICNLQDDDCDGTIDESLTLSSDAANCGRCGHACVSACTAGYCAGETPSSVSAGGAHTCVRRENGTLACFGWNAEGQLGTSRQMLMAIPLNVPGPTLIEQVAPGGSFTCALDMSGAASCVGDGDDGALGRGDRLDARTFGPVMGGASYTRLAAGPRTVCAIDSAGGVRCWGNSTHGQAGLLGSALAPNLIEPPSAAAMASDVSVGLDHACEIVAGEVFCWGSNARGQLGSSFVGDSTTPLRVDGIAGATALASGRDFSCALLTDQQVLCWGANDTGQLGAGSPLSMSAMPLPVMGLSGATAISAAAGGTHVCALTGGTVSCWGGNRSGQLGDGTTEVRNAPVAMSGITGAISVSAGGLSPDGRGHTCVVRMDGEVRCAGDGFLGQTGDSDLSPVRSSAAAVVGLP